MLHHIVHMLLDMQDFLTCAAYKAEVHSSGIG